MVVIGAEEWTTGRETVLLLLWMDGIIIYVEAVVNQDIGLEIVHRRRLLKELPF